MMRKSYDKGLIIFWFQVRFLMLFLSYALDHEIRVKGNNPSRLSYTTNPIKASKSWNNAEKEAFLTAQHTGPIDDASCNVEQLEYANDSQLYSILHELKNTEFFRYFAVDLDSLCPLHTWGEKKNVHMQKSEDQDQSSKISKTIRTPFELIDVKSTCSSDPSTESVCDVRAHEQRYGKNVESVTHDTTTHFTLQPTVKELDFPTCSGGAIAHEIDDESPPLCQLNSDSPFTQTTTSIPARDMLSSALNNINKGHSWESELQKQTFDWSRISDPVIATTANQEPCYDDDNDRVEGKLPDSFWLDMCSSISSGHGLKMVNLALNPERNTGYNGTHIWRAIYEENCIIVDGMKDQPMCYEERVLYRLFSGLHTSTTLSIAMNYYPPNRKKGRVGYEPNPSYFMEKFIEHPDHVRNLHFSYVVLLRALKKAAPFLYTYKIHTGNIVEDETATILLRRLLDSSILSSCNHVFTAFDESLMFQKDSNYNPISKQQELVTLQKTFKGVFHNVSSILDCVQCQQCKLHGKLAMLGFGTALKILFLSRQDMIASSLNRNEIVALLNTISKLSEGLKHIRELTSLYWANHNSVDKTENERSDLIVKQSHIIDSAIGAVAKLAQVGKISAEREFELISLILRHDSDFLSLAKYYASDVEKFFTLSKAVGDHRYESLNSAEESDAIVVGTGLAGLTSALTILDRGGKVILIEKEHRMGGNSNKASSGINACCTGNATGDDNIESFLLDTTKSAGSSVQPDLIRVLVENSASAVEWLQKRVGVDLSLVAQLGGHNHERTHRPQNGMVGAEIIYGMQKAVKAYEKLGKVKILIDTQVTKLLRTESGVVHGVEVNYHGTINGDNKRYQKLMSPNIILATGGFASDRSPHSYLAQYRPELIKMPATAGPFSTGDGIGLATNIGADLIDMEKIQIHPTGWVDPADPTNPNKILAAELMRGIGGILLDNDGRRFCNELGTRAYVTEMMLNHDPYYNRTKMWNASRDIPTFSLILSSAAAKDGEKHVDHYLHKGLLTKVVGVDELSRWMNVSNADLRRTFSQYLRAASEGIDEWGKSSFRGLPNSYLDNETFYAGTVVPVLHYCMGGLTIDANGKVLDRSRNVIPGLYAAGEVTGGVHGDNRLGGNSLLECTVFGKIIGNSIPIRSRESHQVGKLNSTGIIPEAEAKSLKTVTVSDLAEHNRSNNCWIAIHGYVYDLTDFAEEHPGGAESIHGLCGKIGTKDFDAIHSENILDDFDDAKIMYRLHRQTRTWSFLVKLFLFIGSRVPEKVSTIQMAVRNPDVLVLFGLNVTTMLLFFLIGVVFIIAPHFKSLFISRHGWMHRSLGALMICWLIYGTIHATKFEVDPIRKWTISCFVIDFVLSVFGLTITLSAGYAFPHKRVSNSPGQSGTLAEDAIVTHSEMIEHSFYQLINLFQALFLHYTSWLVSIVGRKTKPSISNRLISLSLVSLPWILRKKFPVHSFSANWRLGIEKRKDSSKATKEIELLLYRLKKLQYIFYKHFIVHGLNISLTIFPPKPIDILLSNAQRTDLSIPLSQNWRIFWLSLNASFVMEFFLQTLVKRSVITQRCMIRLQIILMLIASISAIQSGAIFGSLYIDQRLISLKSSFMLRLIIGTTSASLNFLNRGHDFLNTLLVATIMILIAC